VRAVNWNAQREKLGRPKLRIHDLRHTYASLARSAGADLRLLQGTLGHASITVTAHTYADLYDSDLDAVADALDTLRSGIKSDIPLTTRNRMAHYRPTMAAFCSLTTS
jgi:integrase